ncbi:hypothetical protein TNCV_3081091 [Trichonephila clavipes]|nr:hypothetical protein TNCV_3081091 [Trichonephila clavipes]
MESLSQCYVNLAAAAAILPSTFYYVVPSHTQVRLKDVHLCNLCLLRKSVKKKLIHQEALDLLQSLPPEIRDVLTDDFSGEEVPANNLLKFSLDSLDGDQEIE